MKGQGSRAQRVFLMFVLETVKVATKPGRLSEASFCATAFESLYRSREAQRQKRNFYSQPHLSSAV